MSELRRTVATRLVAARGDKSYASVEELRNRAGINVAAVERLAPVRQEVAG